MDVIWYGFEFAIGFALSMALMWKGYAWLRFFWYQRKTGDEIPMDIRIAMVQSALKKIKRTASKMSAERKSETYFALMTLIGNPANDNDVSIIATTLQKELFQALHLVLKENGTSITVDSRDVVAAGRKINAITASEKKTSDELIQAYAQVGSLLPEYDSSLERFGSAITKLPMGQYPGKGREFYEYLRKMGDVWKREVAVVSRMATLPNEDAKVTLWEIEFSPLVDEENRLIENGRSLAAAFDAIR